MNLFPDYDLNVKKVSKSSLQDEIRKTMEMQEKIGINAAKEMVMERLKKRGFSEEEAREISFGKGVRVALMNSGIDITHSEIVDRFVKDNEGENFVSWTYDADGEIRPCIANPKNLYSILPHCLSVAGILAAKSFGILRKAGLYAIKVCDDFGHIEERAIEEALSKIREKDIDLVNMSIGFLRYKHRATGRIHDLCADLGKRIILVASAGNYGGGPSIPSTFSNVLSVAATCCVDKKDDDYHTACDFSNAWPTVDIAAPGERLLCLDTYNSFATRDGTSVAAPIITGILGMAVAYLKTRNRLLIRDGKPAEEIDPLKLEQILKDTACRKERRVLKEDNQRDEIEEAYKKHFGFDLINGNLTAEDFTDFVLGAGRVNAAKFIEKILERYVI
jgi:subtilisin family serine protease